MLGSKSHDGQSPDVLNQSFYIVFIEHCLSVWLTYCQVIVNHEKWQVNWNTKLVKVIIVLNVPVQMCWWSSSHRIQRDTTGGHASKILLETIHKMMMTYSQFLQENIIWTENYVSLYHIKAVNSNNKLI